MRVMQYQFLDRVVVAVVALGLLAAFPCSGEEEAAAEQTPVSLPGSEAFVYRQVGDEALRLFVVKPTQAKPGARRPAFLWFYGGGWRKGTPKHSMGWAQWAAKHGMVGIAADYRTKNRFGTSPLEAVADGRAALSWVQRHAAELGIDPAKIIVGGASAGGHLALWTAITLSPPGSDPREAPEAKPVALILVSPVSDTSEETGYAPERFGANARALSPYHQLDASMPCTLIFHGDADDLIPFVRSVALQQKLAATGNTCELVKVPGGGHGFSRQLPEWRSLTRKQAEEFLIKNKILSPPS